MLMGLGSALCDCRMDVGVQLLHLISVDTPLGDEHLVVAGWRHKFRLPLGLHWHHVVSASHLAFSDVNPEKVLDARLSCELILFLVLFGLHLLFFSGYQLFPNPLLDTWCKNTQGAHHPHAPQAPESLAGWPHSLNLSVSSCVCDMNNSPYI
jgi:hypothetical protein